MHVSGKKCFSGGAVTYWYWYWYCLVPKPVRGERRRFVCLGRCCSRGAVCMSTYSCFPIVPSTTAGAPIRMCALFRIWSLDTILEEGFDMFWRIMVGALVLSECSFWLVNKLKLCFVWGRVSTREAVFPDLSVTVPTLFWCSADTCWVLFWRWFFCFDSLRIHWAHE